MLMLAPRVPTDAAMTNPFRPPPPTLKVAAGETLFRVLYPATKTGGVIGKGAAIIRQVREETGARICIDDSLTGCEELLILIVADSTKKESISSEESSYPIIEDKGSPAQQALVRVFERILKVDEARSGVSADTETSEEKKEGGGDRI